MPLGLVTESVLAWTAVLAAWFVSLGVVGVVRPAAKRAFAAELERARRAWAESDAPGGRHDGGARDERVRVAVAADGEDADDGEVPSAEVDADDAAAQVRRRL